MKNKLECSEIILEEASKWYLHIKMLLYEKNFLFPMEVVVLVFEVSLTKVKPLLICLYTSPCHISFLCFWKPVRKTSVLLLSSHLDLTQFLSQSSFSTHALLWKSLRFLKTLRSGKLWGLGAWNGWGQQTLCMEVPGLTSVKGKHRDDLSPLIPECI